MINCLVAFIIIFLICFATYFTRANYGFVYIVFLLGFGININLINNNILNNSIVDAILLNRMFMSILLSFLAIILSSGTVSRFNMSRSVRLVIFIIFMVLFSATTLMNFKFNLDNKIFYDIYQVVLDKYQILTLVGILISMFIVKDSFKGQRNKKNISS